MGDDGERSFVHATLEFEIKDFSTATEKLYKWHRQNEDDYDIGFGVSVYPHGVDKNTEGWVIVSADLHDELKGIDKETYDLKWIVSIIDAEGNYRFPKSFERNISAFDMAEARYLETSFILERQDELFSERTLRLSCDTYLDFRCKKSVYMWDLDKELQEDHVCLIFGFRPKSASSKKDAKSKDTSGFYKAFKFTPKDFKTPESNDFKQSKVRLIGSGASLPGSEPTDKQEDLWMFDTCPDRFLVSLIERPENVGHQLVESSPVIRRCMDESFVEGREKRVKLSNVKSKTFLNVLYLLETGKLLNRRFDEIVEVYEFLHLYGMESQLQKCAECIVQAIETEAELEVAEKIAVFYSDEYLSTLLDSHKNRNENFTTVKKNERPDFDCYI